MRYRTIVADPPWPYESPGAMGDTTSRGRCGAGSVKRYGAMNLEELAVLQPPAEDDAHLYLWTTNAFVVEAHDLAQAWGFSPKTVLTWTKTFTDDPARVSMKTGYYFRGASEHVVFGVRGSLRTEGTWPTSYLWPRQPHSVKPDAFYDLVEQASPGPYLELFARRARFGWDYWGDESLGTAEMPAA